MSAIACSIWSGPSWKEPSSTTSFTAACLTSDRLIFQTCLPGMWTPEMPPAVTYRCPFPLVRGSPK
eukprot:3593708-Lingulodinium_polyedra.AAC.1